MKLQIITTLVKPGVLALLVAVLAVAAAPASAQSDTEVSKPLIVDVRTPYEFKQAHFPGALNIPLDQVDKRIGEFGEKTQPIVVYCRSGRRSGLAKKVLDEAGYKTVVNGGGLDAMLKRLANK